MGSDCFDQSHVGQTYTITVTASTASTCQGAAVSSSLSFYLRVASPPSACNSAIISINEPVVNMAYIVGSTATYDYGSVTSPYPYEVTNTNGENCGAFDYTLVVPSSIQSMITVRTISANEVKFKLETTDNSLAGTYTGLKL